MVKSKYADVADPIEAGERRAEAAHAPTLEAVDEAIYGKPMAIDTGRQVALPLDVNKIKPDPAQPRRTIPRVVEQLAAERNIPAWEAWWAIAEKHGEKINLKARLMGTGDGSAIRETDVPLRDDFLSLVDLAASIRRDGLINPISVYQLKDGYQIEAGEGRWWAHQMLRHVLGDAQYGKIAARVVAARDVWRQAAENGARRPLNAIGMARQIALLVMEFHQKPGAFDSYEKMILPGEADRRFYAQVRSGHLYPIPKGQSERCLQVTGLKSRAQLAQYRALLDISDEMWVKADDEGWSEGRVRAQLQYLTMTAPVYRPLGTTPAAPVEAARGTAIPPRAAVPAADQPTHALPSYLEVGERVEFNHPVPAYRVSGTVSVVKWDKGIRDYKVWLKAENGKQYGPYGGKHLIAAAPQQEAPQRPERPEWGVPGVMVKHMPSGLVGAIHDMAAYDDTYSVTIYAQQELSGPYLLADIMPTNEAPETMAAENTMSMERVAALIANDAYNGLSQPTKDVIRALTHKQGVIAGFVFNTYSRPISVEYADSLYAAVQAGMQRVLDELAETLSGEIGED